MLQKFIQPKINCYQILKHQTLQQKSTDLTKTDTDVV